MTAEKPKPCPFCGSERINVDRDYGLSRVAWCKCRACGAVGPSKFLELLESEDAAEERAIKAWNKAPRGNDDR